VPLLPTGNGAAGVLRHVADPARHEEAEEVFLGNNSLHDILRVMASAHCSSW